jgi:DNA-binding transcriptional LysR family regulator
MIRIGYFEAFNAVMLSGSMTAAATMMHTSQPNISRSISRLEKETGLKLFERVPGKLLPTSDGQALFEEVQRSFAGLHRLTEAASRIKRLGSGKLRVGTIQSPSLSLVPRAIKCFSKEFPQVTLSIHSAHTSILTQFVREHSCDFAIVAYEEENGGVDSEILYTTDAVCILPLLHPLIKKEFITPKDLAGERFITFPRGELSREFLDRVFREADVEPLIAIETSYSSITCSLVVQGVGVAVVNPYIAREYLHAGLVARPFIPAPQHREVLIFPAGKPRGRLVERFVELLKSLVVKDQESISKMLQAYP